MKLKKRKEHYTVYSKQQAVDMLYNDERVNYIDETSTTLTIMTKPIMLKPTRKKDKELIVCPIGKYEIFISQCNSCSRKHLKVDIERVAGPIAVGDDNMKVYHSHHICTTWGSKICWGNADGTAQKLRDNMDWYWLAKLSLELISDSEPEEGMANTFMKTVLIQQYQHAKVIGHEKNQKQIMKLIRKHARFRSRKTIEKFI